MDFSETIADRDPKIGRPRQIIEVMKVCQKNTGYPRDGRADKDSYPHDGRADKDSYPHDGRADKDSYSHDRHNQYIMLRL